MPLVVLRIVTLLIFRLLQVIFRVNVIVHEEIDVEVHVDGDLCQDDQFSSDDQRVEKQNAVERVRKPKGKIISRARCMSCRPKRTMM